MKYLVPYDFSPITRSSLDHAIAISKDVPGEIELLHIIDNEIQRDKMESKLDQLISSLPLERSERVYAKVRVGDIYVDIAKEAEEGNADLLIMGTHGAKGLQKLFGSRAIKVITSSKTPFLVTQLKGPQGAIDLIVLPVDLSKESLQIVKFATNVAKKFNSKIHIVCKPEKDEWLAKKLMNNINWAKMKMSDDVDYKVMALDGEHSFAREVIDYGEEHGADMFAITHFSDSILPQFDTFTQEVITNRLEVPVLVIEGRQTSDIGTNFTFIGM